MKNAAHRTWLSGGLCLLPDGPARRDLLVAGSAITQVLPAGQGTPAAGDEQIDASGLLVVPGLVNAHTHSPDNLAVGTAPALPLETWSIACASARTARPAPREVYVSTLLGCIEMLRSGTTTVLDHVRFAAHLDADCLDAVARAYHDAGMRAVVAPVVADLALADTLPLEACDLQGASCDAAGAPQMPAAEQVARVKAFIDKWHGAAGRIQGAVGPSGPQRCTDELLQHSAALARERGLPLHSHVLETRVQQSMAQRRYGGSMLAHLQVLGVLDSYVNLVHMVWATETDLDIVAASGATVVHNPVSNARLGSGVAPVPAMLRRGIPVALGTDSACCNDSNCMLETAKWAALIHNTRCADPADWLDASIVLRMATSQGAAVLGLGTITGTIAPGMAADLALFRLRAPGMVPLHDPVRQLVLSHGCATAALVMVAGRILVRDGRCTALAEDDIWAEAQSLADSRRNGPQSAAHPLSLPIYRMHRRIHALAAIEP